MKFLFDLFPVLVFFAAFKLGDIYVATAAAMIATGIQVAWLKLRRQRVSPMLWTTLGLIVVFGGATLLLHDEIYIKWKPTVLYWLFAVVLIGAHLLLGRNLIRMLLAAEIELPEQVWVKVNWSWAIFFLLMGAVNLYVAFRFPMDTWVNFKTFIATGLFFVFAFGQAIYFSRHLESEHEGPKR